MIINRLFLILVVLFCVFLIALPTQAKYSGGTGDSNTPFLISDANDMNEIGTHPEDWGSHFLLVNDINLAEYTGTQFNVIGNDYDNAFSGVFDGNGHMIYNFTYSSSGTDYVGIFGYVRNNNDVIKDLTLIDPNVDSGTGPYNCYVGSLVGFLRDGTIRRCGVNGGRVSGGSFTGGLVGQTLVDTTTIIDCYATCIVQGNHQTGGLVGSNERGTIQNCYTSADVQGNESVGGLVGNNCHTTAVISNCYVTSNVLGNAGVGGLVGNNDRGPISDCYAAGNVTGNDRTGGLVGSNPDGQISNCFATGYVNGNGNPYTGGLFGSTCSKVNSCFWDMDTTGQSSGVGDGSSGGVTGKTTAEMQKESTFTDWDFIEIWNIGENQTYPYLRIYPAGDLNHDGIVNLSDFAIFAEHWLEGTQ